MKHWQEDEDYNKQRLKNKIEWNNVKSCEKMSKNEKMSDVIP